MKIAPLSFCLTLFNLHILITTVNAAVDENEKQISFKNRIVNGRDAKVGQFPYQLSLRRSSSHVCGAAVLDGNWAITAAHCIDGFERVPNLFTLRMGSTARLLGGLVTEVKGVYKHPSYNPESMTFDVALLRTPDNSFSGNNVAAIALPKSGDSIKDNDIVTVSGWGHMSSSDHILSNVLKYTRVSIVNQDECHEKLKFQGGITEAMFCAAARDTDACQGDSGGPIVSDENILIGVVSWGVGCADPHYPGVYTRLSHSPIRGWIRLLTKL